MWVPPEIPETTRERQVEQEVWLHNETLQMRILRERGATLMTHSEQLLFLTEREAKRLMSRQIPVVCCRCGKLIQIDESYVRKRTSGKCGLTIRYYHEKCWKQTFFGD